jgi:hypothetical protein
VANRVTGNRLARLVWDRGFSHVESEVFGWEAEEISRVILALKDGSRVALTIEHRKPGEPGAKAWIAARHFDV